MAGDTELTWQVVYSHRGVVALKLVKGEAGAIDAACEILDAGDEVHRAEIAGTLTVMDAPQLRRIWQERIQERTAARSD